MKSFQQSLAWSCLFTSLALFSPPVFAANDPWTGNGADANWGTGGNWASGNQPANNDILTFGASARQNNTNNLSSLTVGVLNFTNGGFTLNGNNLTLNPTTVGVVTNLTGLNIIALPLTITPAGQYWAVASNSEVRLTGPVVDNAAGGTSSGWLVLTNGGTVRIMNSASSQRGMDIFNGTVIIDGGSVYAGTDGIRFKPQTGYAATVIITNSGYVKISGGGNFRMGNSGTVVGPPAGPFSLSQANLYSGTLELNGAATTLYDGDQVAGAAGLFNQYGGLVWGSYSYTNAVAGNSLSFGNGANSTGTYNLNGGILWIGQILQANGSATNTVFNFNGGTLKPEFNSTTYFQGLTAANVLSGGAIIDTTNWNITIGQSLQAGTPSGGLTKLGSGTLTLTGPNTYTGNTVVSNGTLVTSFTSFDGGGAITVLNNANVTVPYGGGSPLAASTLNLGSSVTNSVTLNFGLSPSPGSGPAISVGALHGTGVAQINVAGTNFVSGIYHLIGFGSITGASSFQLGTLPLGMSATLQNTGSSLDLNVAYVPKNLDWSGAATPNWDTVAINWDDLNNGDNPTNYAQSGGVGDAVTFDDNGVNNPNVNVGITVTPSLLVFNNNGVNYTFSGTGKISGPVALLKSSSGSGQLTISTTNDYAGGTTIQEGQLYVGCNQALGQGTVTIDGLPELANASGASCTLTNPVVLTANSTTTILGDPNNTGVLTLNGPFDFGSLTTRTLTLNSEVILGGQILCTGGGGFSTLSGSGELVIQGRGVVNTLGVALEQTTPNVLINGGSLNLGNGWRLMAASGVNLDLAVTNGGSLFITNAVNSPNLRVGYSGGDNSAANTVDVAGLVQLYGTGGNGYVSMGASGATDTVNLWPGGTLICGAIVPNGTVTAQLIANFYGGTLTPFASTTTFMQGLTNAFIWSGLTVDTTNYSITIAQPLLAGGTGGLTKLGTGILTLTGSNTYVGPTLVNAGELVLTSPFSSPSAITVSSNSTLAFQQAAGALTTDVASVTAGGTNCFLEADLTSTNTPAATITNLILNGVVAVNVTGITSPGNYPLFAFSTIGGPGHLSTGSLAQGLVGHLTTNYSPNIIYLDITSVNPDVWTGATNGLWDTATTNWTSAGVPVAYAQLANVLFNDSASNATVTLTNTLTPSSVVVSNTALNYQLGGPGILSGGTALTKYGAGTLTITNANTFGGNATITAGSVLTGNATALGAGTIYVTNSGTLDVDGSNLGNQAVVVSGAGVNNIGALVNSGAAQNNAYNNVTLAGDTTVGGTNSIGLRTSADNQPGLIGNGFNLTKIGPSQFNINGGQTTAGLLNVWTTNLGNVDIKAGILSFQRRSALGLTNNTITVEPQATLLLFSLNQNLPVPVNHIVMTNALLQSTAGTAGDTNVLGGVITLNGQNSISATNAISSILYFTGPLVGPGGAVYDGPVFLFATNTYTGPTVIDSGRLTVATNGGLSGTTSITLLTNSILDVALNPLWTLGASQTLAGYGAVNGTVQANGTVSPGTNNGIGTLSFSTLTLGGNTAMVLNKGNAGQTNDVIMVTNTLTYGGALNVTITGPALAANDTYTLFRAGSILGSFSSTNLPSAYIWDTSQLAAGTLRVVGSAVRPHPGFTSVTTSGNILNLGGTNATGTYVLYSSTNLLTPVLNWTPVWTNTFSGNFMYYVTNDLSAPQKFYLLQ